MLDGVWSRVSGCTRVGPENVCQRGEGGEGGGIVSFVRVLTYLRMVTVHGMQTVKCHTDILTVHPCRGLTDLHC